MKSGRVGYESIMPSGSTSSIALENEFQKAREECRLRYCKELTPLHYAIEGRHVEIVRKLVKYGANVEAKARFDGTPLEMASSAGLEEISKILRQV
jgi:hypothetical protein